MAGDWIKIQKETPDKPEVLAIASRLGIDPDAVTGKLVRIWSWFDTHTTDGNASSVTFAFLDRLAGVTGFAEQMALVGWLSQKGHVLSLPNFDYHTGETAKKRALGQKRQMRHRSNAESNAASVTKASPEKRREEKKINTATAVAAPDGVSVEVWDAFLKTRQAKRAPMSDLALASIKREADAAGWSLEAALSECVARGWQAFKAEWVKNSRPAGEENPIFRGAI